MPVEPDTIKKLFVEATEKATPAERAAFLDEALTKLASADPEAAQLVQLRYFAGLPIPEAARTLGVSPRTADRLWAFARAWLLREVGGEVPGDQIS